VNKKSMKREITIALKSRYEFVRRFVPLFQENWSEQHYIYDLPYRIREVLHLLTHVSISPPAQVLEIGTGGGGLLAYSLSKLGYKVIGVNHNCSVECDNDNLRKGFPNLEVYCFSIGQEPIPRKSQTFDLIVCNHTIEHLHMTPKFLLKEITRLLKTGGWVYISNPNAGRLMARLRPILGRRYYPLSIEKHFENFGQPTHTGHVREFSPSELYYMIARAGFRNIKSGTFNNLFRHVYKPRSRWYGARAVALATALFPPLRDTAYVVAQK